MGNGIRDHYIRGADGGGIKRALKGVVLGGILIFGGSAAAAYAEPVTSNQDVKISYQKAVEMLNLKMGTVMPNMTENFGKNVYSDVNAAGIESMVLPNPFGLNSTDNEEVLESHPKAGSEYWKNFNFTDASMYPGPRNGSPEFSAILESQELIADATAKAKIGRDVTDEPDPVKTTDFNNGYKNRAEKIGNGTAVQNEISKLRFLETYGNYTSPGFKKN